jgi:hypothetical protein
MNAKATVSADGETITIHIPLTFRKRGGRKMIVTPDGAPWAPRPRVDNALVRAVARAFRWQRMLDEGACGTIAELARREKVTKSIMSRVLRLTLLAPDIVEAVLDGRQSEEMRLVDLLEGLPVEWEGQSSPFGRREGAGSLSASDVRVERDLAQR